MTHTHTHVAWLDPAQTVELMTDADGNPHICKNANVSKLLDSGFQLDRASLLDVAAKLRMNEFYCQIQIDSPYVAHPRGITTAQKTAKLFLPFVEGETLTVSTPRISPRDALASIEDVARALNDIHRSGIIHRDIKPDNIVRSSDGRITVIDYDLSVRTSEFYFDDSRRVIYALATPGFEPPEHHYLMQNGLSCASFEQVQHWLPSTRTDVYGLGKTLLFVLSHHEPLRTDALTKLAAAMTARDAHLRPSLDVVLEQLGLQKQF